MPSDAESLDALDRKVSQVFAGKVVRKELVRKLKFGSTVPVYVLEYLLGKYCATDDPLAVEAGLKIVNSTLAENFVRPDDSVIHAFHFDLETGKPLGGDNHCGFSTDSYWARGAAWGIYGFALNYGHTRDEKYLQAAVRLAKKFITQRHIDGVPLWDFRLPADRPLRCWLAAPPAPPGSVPPAAGMPPGHWVQFP